MVHGATWDKETRSHTCCGSKHTYHKSWCPEKVKSLIPGLRSDPDYMAVQFYKAQGYTSGEIARELGLALAHVNELYLI